MKSALFVDFDNVYSGLRRMDSAIADCFARQPLEQVNWLTDFLGLPDHAPKGAKRRLNETGKRVRDQCRTAGHGISRADVGFVLMGLTFVGHVFGSGNDGADVLAERFADNAIALCRREQMVDDESTTTAIRKWIQGHAEGVPDGEAKARETPYAK